MDEARALVDARLASISDDARAPSPLEPVVTAALTSSGKRVRAILLISMAEACGGVRDHSAVVDAGAAIEMIHACSLVLDDLPAMDDAILRRGEPALHRQFGEDRAILAAVALLNHSYGEISRSWSRVRPRRYGLDDLLTTVVEAVGWDGSIGGEAVDLHSEGSSLDFETLEYIHSRKTGALFVASAAVGAMLANASQPSLSAARAYAKNLGLAFQITDDVLDVTATESELGKDVGKDEQRLTFVKLAGVEGSKDLVGELVGTSISALAPFGRKGRRLSALAEWVRSRIS